MTAVAITDANTRRRDMKGAGASLNTFGREVAQASNNLVPR